MIIKNTKTSVCDMFFYVDESGNQYYKEIANEPHTVLDNQISLEELPSELYGVQIIGMIETKLSNSLSKLGVNYFKVDYNHQKVYFHADKEGDAIELTYRSRGYLFLDSNKVYNPLTGESLFDTEDQRTKSEDDRIVAEALRLANEIDRGQNEDLRITEFNQIKLDYATASNYTVVTFDSYDFVATIDNTTTFTVPMGIYNPVVDILKLYRNNVPMFEGDNYSRLGAEITLGFTINTGEIIKCEVMKAVINETPTADGSNMMNGSITKVKLSADVQNTLNTADSRTATFTSNTLVSSGLSNITTGLVGFNPTLDKLIVTYNGYELLLGIHYSQNANNTSIDLIAWTANTGDIFIFKLYKNIL